jgi:hypothetical protein
MITISNIGAKEEPYPMLGNVWDFFSTKGTKTVFVSVGTGNTCLPELDFAETIGCKILKLDTPETSKKWTEVADVLKTRKVTDETSEFAKMASRKWVLPKNLIIHETIPSYHNGTITVDGTTLQTRSWSDILEEYCTKTIGLHPEDVHIDLLKIDSCPFDDQVLSSLFASGFRPSLLLINWNSTPDTDMHSMNTAAHLQMMGYALVGKEDSRFLYYYTDVNYYETCSWEKVANKFENPLMRELVRSIYPGTEGVVLFPKVE